MTQFMNKSFSVHMASDQNYRDNWDRIFQKKTTPEVKPPEPLNDDSRVVDWWETPVSAEQYDCGGCDVCDRMFGRR